MRKQETDMRLEPINLYDYEARARQVLPHDVWDEIESGAMDEFSTRRNRTALEALTLRPRLLRDISHQNLSTTLLGTPISMPVFVCPAGGHKIAHPEGELATARGAGMSETLMILSSGSNYSLEEVAKAATGPLWQQLGNQDHQTTGMLVRRAEEAGFKAICLTVDTPTSLSNQERTLGSRYGQERSFRNRYAHPFERANFPQGVSPLAQRESLTWEDVEWLRSFTQLPLVLKGIRTAEDAYLAVEHGVNGIQVSNHGGRQIDMTFSSIETLPEIVQVVDSRAELYLDSGIRRGSDVVKALAMGVRAVGIGRPLFWGLAVAGAEGVHGVLEILRKELSLAMGFCGQTDVAESLPGMVNIPQGWGVGTTVP